MPPCRTPGCRNRSTGHGLCPACEAGRKRHNDATRPSASARGYDARWREARARYLLAHPTCALCGDPATEAHHITRKRDGGTDDDANLMALCHACHSRITASTQSFGRAETTAIDARSFERR